MDDMSVTRLRFAANERSEPFDTDLSAYEEATDPARSEWAPRRLQDLLDEVAGPPTLRERLENWGSD